MKVLITIPHVFAPVRGSLYSSQTEEKRQIKQTALFQATIGNLCRLGQEHRVHASLGLKKPVVTRKLNTNEGAQISIQIYTPADASLVHTLPLNSNITYINPEVSDFTKIASIASRRALEQAENYDLICYMEDDLLIEDSELFRKILYLVNLTKNNYAFLPHRCELIPEKGDVILSGDPDGGRPDLFWDTKEQIEIAWPLGNKKFYRATNPHSGCYFLSKNQAIKTLEFWQKNNWCAEFQLSGPLEQAGSGMLLPILKIMKPIPAHYRFLMIRHQDELWKRHPDEN